MTDTSKFLQLLSCIFPDHPQGRILAGYLALFMFDIMQDKGQVPQGVKYSEVYDEQTEERAIKNFEEQMLTFSYKLLTDAIFVLKKHPFPDEALEMEANRKFPSPEEARAWFLRRMHRLRSLALQYAEERRQQGLPLEPLPEGVTLPELPVE